VPDALTLAVRTFNAPTPTTRRLVLDLAGTPFTYQAGQAALIGLHGHRERRPYSFASAPADTSSDGGLEFLLRTDPGGGLGRHLDAIAPGARVDFEGPFGTFLLPDPLPEAALIFVAGGTGLAPLRSLARQAAARGHRWPRHLVYSVCSPDDLAYAEELETWTDVHGGQAHITVTRAGDRPWSGQRGRIDATALQRLIGQRLPLCFLCGPPPMVEAVAAVLSHLGVPADHLLSEQGLPAM